MIIIIGLVILIVAVIVAVVGALANSGSGHALPHDFAVLGYHVTGSTGTLFLFGVVVGANAFTRLAVAEATEGASKLGAVAIDYIRYKQAQP